MATPILWLKPTKRSLWRWRILVAIALATNQVSSIENDTVGVRSSDATVERIVEYKDATDSERRLTEYNTGLYLVRHPTGRAIEDGPSGVTGEYYLTVVALGIADGYQVAAVGVHRPSERTSIRLRSSRL